MVPFRNAAFASENESHNEHEFRVFKPASLRHDSVCIAMVVPTIFEFFKGSLMSGIGEFFWTESSGFPLRSGLRNPLGWHNQFQESGDSLFLGRRLNSGVLSIRSKWLLCNVAACLSIKLLARCWLSCSDVRYLCTVEIRHRFCTG